MCRTMIGIDGGGTKTEFVLFSEDGKIIKRLVSEGCNPNTIGLKGAIAVLKRGIDQLVIINSDVCAIFIGGSGFASGGQGKQIEQELCTCYPRVKIRCETDVFNLIACSSNPNQCIAVICGTGSVVFANENGTLKRFGGGGFLIDKGGSGYHIGRDALYQALYERDGIAKTSLITDLVMQKLGTDVWSSIGDIYKQGQSFIASFAPLVFEAYVKKDDVASEILEKNADSLAKLICQANKQCKTGNVVIFSGSVVTKTEVFLDMIKRKLSPELQIEVLNMPQVYGACVMCCELCGIDKNELTKKFIERYEEVLKC